MTAALSYDLVEALVRRETQRFIAAVGEADGEPRVG
jgi:hypothetical protein